MDKKERKKLKDFFNKIVDRWKVSSNDSHMGIISFGSNESLIFVLHKKYPSADALNKRVADTIFHDSTKHGICTDLSEDLAEKAIFTS